MSGLPSRREPITVLLIGDDRNDARLVEDAFDEIGSDATLRTITTDGDVVDRLRRQVRERSLPNLVLLNLDRPVSNGCGVLEWIRETDGLRHLPVIVLARSDKTTDILRCYDALANAYLIKPERPEGFVPLARSIDQFWLEKAVLPPRSSQSQSVVTDSK